VFGQDRSERTWDTVTMIAGFASRALRNQAPTEGGLQLLAEVSAPRSFGDIFRIVIRIDVEFVNARPLLVS